MKSAVRYVLDVLILLIALGVQWQLHGWWASRPWTLRSAARRRGVAWTCAALATLTVVGVAFSIRPLSDPLPGWLVYPVQGLAYLWAFYSVGLFAALRAWLWLERRSRAHSPGRRRLLRAAGAATLAAPAVATGYGVFIQRSRIRLREMSVPVADLPRGLDGLRIVQLTDIHLSPYLSEAEFAPAIDMANETRAHLAVVTGDLISRVGDPLDACLRHLARLRSDAGTLGCLGNHERYAEAERYTAERGARMGLRFLRDESVSLRFGEATLQVAGCDYQPRTDPYLVGMGRHVRRRPGTLNLLMSHNPDVFPVAAAQGYGMTLAGHTHGGQVTVEIVSQYANVARFFTPYVDGLYAKGRSSLFVSRGIGTVGLPIRLGTPPEVALLTLRCSSLSPCAT